MTDETIVRLREALARTPRLAIAVSGGVDSMTLAHVAHGAIDVQMVHALSPAVPAEATARVRAHAGRHGWELVTTAAGEFDDERYVSNPSDRCYFCKTNLYDRIATLTDRPIASGANLDDLGDYRPGLLAAGERGVVHPLVEAGIDKQGVRAIARRLKLDDLSELPAQPCLASRVETGIAIEARDLAFIDEVERAVRQAVPGQEEVRCRITRRGVVLELADAGHAGEAETIARRLAAMARRDFAGVAPYRRGSAFLR